MHSMAVSGFPNKRSLLDRQSNYHVRVPTYVLRLYQELPMTETREKLTKLPCFIAVSVITRLSSFLLELKGPDCERCCA